MPVNASGCPQMPIKLLRLVVTGRHGQVVRALTELACVEGAPVAGLSVFTIARPELDLAGEGDLEASFAQLKPDVIVNAAAYTAVDKAESERELAFSINANGAGRVARAAHRLGVPVIQLSTDYVFDGSATNPYVEDDSTAPINYYGVTKLAGERLVQEATSNHVTLRTSWVYAPFGQNFVMTMLRLGAQREEMRVVGDQYGSPTSALDIATSIVRIALALVERPEDPSLRGIFHMTNQGTTTWAGFASEIFRLSAERGGNSTRVIPIPTSEYPTPARRPMSSRLSNAKLAEVYGLHPALWSDALRNVLDKISSS